MPRLPRLGGAGRQRSRGRGKVEQRARVRAEFFGVEKPDNAVLTVEPGLADHFRTPQPANCLHQRGRADLGDRVEGNLGKNLQLRAEPGGQRGDLRGHGLALRPDPEDLPHDLGQCHQRTHLARGRRTDPFGTVGKRIHPVQDPDGQRPSALRAETVRLPGLARFVADVTLAVTVEVVLALFGEELDRAGETVPGAQRRKHGEVVDVAGERGRLPAEHGRGVRVGVADQAEPVEPGQPPEHRRVRRQAGFQCEDVVGQIDVAVLDRVKTGLGAQHREPRRPHVGRYQVAAVARAEGDLQ